MVKVGGCECLGLNKWKDKTLPVWWFPPLLFLFSPLEHLCVVVSHCRASPYAQGGSQRWERDCSCKIHNKFNTYTHFHIQPTPLSPVALSPCAWVAQVKVLSPLSKRKEGDKKRGERSELSTWKNKNKNNDGPKQNLCWCLCHRRWQVYLYNEINH